jgi:glyoxylase-like metal-dependent hydrolase (beta-lactamase superfamily II)
LSWVLIDTSWPDRGQLIKQTAERLFGAGTRPAAILLTHTHGDHAGSALELARSWDLPVYAHPGELPLAAGKYLPEYGDPIGRWLIEPLMRLTPRRAARMAAKASITEAAQAFNPEAGVPGLPDWEYIPTPGHTPGHVCFFRPGDPGLDHRRCGADPQFQFLAGSAAVEAAGFWPSVDLHLELADGEALRCRARPA